MDAAFWSCLSGTIWAFPASNAGQNLQGKEGYKNSGQEGMLLCSSLAAEEPQKKVTVRPFCHRNTR